MHDLHDPVAEQVESEEVVLRDREGFGEGSRRLAIQSCFSSAIARLLQLLTQLTIVSVLVK